MSHPNLEQLNALNRFALANGRTWRTKLLQLWHKDVRATDHQAAALLRQIRNDHGLELLQTFKPHPSGWTKVGKLVKDSQERFNLKRGWRVNAWRIVDEAGRDLVQPWSDTKADASTLAFQLNVFLVPE